MKVDTNQIKWLFENETQYRISKETGVAQPVIARLKNGERKLENASIKVGAALTAYAEKLKNEKE